MIQDRDPGDETHAELPRVPRFTGHPAEDAFDVPPLRPQGLRPPTVDELRDDYGPTTSALMGPWGRAR